MKKLFAVMSGILFLPVYALADGFDGRPMHGWGPSMHFGFGGITMWILLLVVVGVILYIVFDRTKPGRGGILPGERPIDILKQRYARGEITKENFQEMKQNLEQ